MTLPQLLHEKRVRPLALLLRGCLLLSGCSLSLPKSEDLFRQPAKSLDGGFDAATGSRGEGGRPRQDADTGGDSGSATKDDETATKDAESATRTDAGQDAGHQLLDPARGLVLHYRFNENSGNAVHDFAGDNDALVVGTPDGYNQWVAEGRIDGALSLSGGTAADAGTGQYVELPQGVLLGLTECSISLWVNRSGGPSWQRVFDFGSGPPVWLYFTPSGGTGLPLLAGRTPALIFLDYQPISGAPDGEGVLSINTPIPVSTWVHVVFTWKSDEAKLYLDGKLVAQTKVHAGVKPSDLGNTGQNYLGRSQYAADPYFDGMIDEFRIYNRVLSASDVAQLHDQH